MAFLSTFCFYYGQVHADPWDPLRTCMSSIIEASVTTMTTARQRWSRLAQCSIRYFAENSLSAVDYQTKYISSCPSAKISLLYCQSEDCQAGSF